MSIDLHLSRADVLDAFRKAIVITQTTVEPNTPAAAALENLLKLTVKLQQDAEADEAAWRVIGPLLERFEQAVSRG